MTRTLKSLGLAVVAVLAMSAVVASAAQAQATTAKFTSMGKYPATFTGANGAGQETFKTEAGTVECASSFHGVTGEATQTVEVSPTYTGCVAFGFLNATVSMEGCKYTFKLTTTLINPHRYQAHVNVHCPAGKTIKIVSATCEVSIGAQTGLTTVDLQNSADTKSILVTPTVGGISYTVVKDGFGCPFAGTGAKTGATYTSHSATSVTSSEGIHIG